MNLFLFFLALSAIFPARILCQSQNSSVSDFVSMADLIIVAKCVEVGTVNKIAISRISVDVISVLKGESSDKLIYSGGPPLTPGRFYLIRFPSNDLRRKSETPNQDRETAIEIISEAEAIKLKELSVEIAIRRTINLRIGRLESDLGLINYELDDLKKLQKEN